MEVIVEIEHSQDLTQTATIYKTPVWKYRLWNVYEKKLSFMSDSSKYNRSALSVGGVVIDYLMYQKVNSLEECLEYEMSWFLDENLLYIHYKNHDPPCLFSSKKTGVLYGFSNMEPVRIGNAQYLPDLLQVPDIEESADILKYNRMKFMSGAVKVNNSRGQNDGVLSVFGNNINIHLVKENTLELFQQFYVSKYSINSKSTTFTCKDRREKLSFSCPGDTYSKETYPFIDNKYEGKVIQDAYGFCKNIPGICLDVNNIYINPDLMNENIEPEDDSNFNDWFTFKFAREITGIDTIEAKMRDKDGNDLWVEIYPGLGVRDYSGTEYKDSDYKYQKQNPNPPVINHSEGTIKIWWKNALKDNTGHLFGRCGDVNEIRATGVFNPFVNPADIVKDMLIYYGKFQYDETYFFLDEWELEIGFLPFIGVFLDSKKSVYEWIEKIQSGCLMGWQMFIYKDRFTVRLDDPNRNESFRITASEIENIHDVEVEFDGENFASYADIGYRPDYSEKTSSRIIDKSSQDQILDIYQYEKSFENDSLLWEEKDAKKKAEIILEDFSKVRPVMRGIKLKGRKWFDLRIYDIGIIDFSIELPERMKALQPFLEDRDFMGQLRCQVIGRKISLVDETVEIEVRQRDLLDAIDVNEVSGEYAETTDYECEFDNMYANTPYDNFDVLIDGGRL